MYVQIFMYPIQKPPGPGPVLGPTVDTQRRSRIWRIDEACICLLLLWVFEIAADRRSETLPIRAIQWSRLAPASQLHGELQHGIADVCCSMPHCKLSVRVFEQMQRAFDSFISDPTVLMSIPPSRPVPGGDTSL